MIMDGGRARVYGLSSMVFARGRGFRSPIVLSFHAASVRVFSLD